MPGPLVVHQLLPTLHHGDAAGAHTLQVQRALREAGFVSELFVEHCDEQLRGAVHHYSELGGFCRTGRTALLYQMAIGSNIADMLLERPEPLILNYHNLTPASYFWSWDPGLVDGIVWGHVQLHRLVAHTFHAIAVSSFNRLDLDRAGYVSTAVSAPLVDAAGWAPGGTGPSPAQAQEPSAAQAREPGPAGARWLFVGRLAPNKAAHDLVKALAVYRKVYDPAARLVLVGGHGHPAYTAAVRSLIETLGLGDAVELAGSVTPGQLHQAYATADVFTCASDHEGFCFPLLEAMYHGLPIVAYGAAAVPETIGGGGVVLSDKQPTTFAAAVHVVLQNPDRRRQLVGAGRRRLQDFELQPASAAMVGEVRRGLVNAELLPGRPSWSVS